jgi:hypothetical protein
MITPSIRLITYTNPSTMALDHPNQADELVTTLYTYHHNLIELDFTDVEDIGVVFKESFLQLADNYLQQKWLLPKNYNIHCGRLVHPLLDRLKQQREQAWIDSVEKVVIE